MMRLLVALIVGSLLAFPQPVAAQQQFWRKGNTFHAHLGGKHNRKEVAVIAVSTTYNSNTGHGMENIRVFTRSYNARIDDWSTVEGLRSVKLRFRANPGNRAPLALSVYESTPSPGPENGCIGGTFGSLVADIVGYFNRPNNLIGYITAELLDCGGVYSYSEANAQFDKTVEIDAGFWQVLTPLDNTDLAKYVSFQDADPATDNLERGVAAWLDFYLEPDATNYRVDAISTLTFQYDPLDSRWPFLRSTSTVGFPHTVNSR